MDIKKIGLIALVVIGVIAAAWSFRSAFMAGPAPASPADGARMREVMQQSYKQTAEKMQGQQPGQQPGQPGQARSASPGN